MEKGKNWIYSKGRDLEITMFNAIFNNDKEDLLTSLSLYQGENGGIGNQLFYNKLGETVYETYLAMKILIDCNYDLEEDWLINEAYDYLFANGFEATPYYAGLIGAGVKLLNKNSENYKKCLAKMDEVVNNYNAKDLDTFKSYIMFANATLNQDIINKIKDDLYNVVTTSELNIFEFINNDLLVTDELKDIVNKALDNLIESRISSGAWLCEDIDDIETIKKSGALTINNMLILKNFNRLN